MTKYLAQASYTPEGMKGLLQYGGSKRREAVDELAESLGGKVEAYYYAFGENDVFVIFDLPNHISAATASMVVNSSGAARVKMAVLLTPEDVDEVTEKTATYFPPGQK
jgi:uncharacterized protein with GYD domain